MRNRHRRGIAALGTAAGAGLLLFVFLQWQSVDRQRGDALPTDSERIAESGSSSTPDSLLDIEADQPVSSRPANATALDIDALIARSSLRGTQADGEVALLPDGRLRIDPELRRRLDYYLTLIGELSLEEIRALLEADIAWTQGQRVADLVVEFFDRYVAMQQAMARSELPNDPLARFERIQAMRRQWLGADADRLFADEIDYDAYTAERLAVRSADLSANGRAELLDELEASRPQSERLQRMEALTPLAVDQQTETFERQQIDAATRHAERSALWGDEAADRLTALDAQRQQWQQRLESYAAARQGLLTNTQMSSTARDQALAGLLSGFSPEEQARLRSLADAGALPDGG